ncbi:MAG: hypothetical protein KDI13_04610 [Alphaproteobacteria bacterium]|nr:hypothetical protein [Alphaproteobacteria bacterium]
MQGTGPATTLHFSPLLEPVWIIAAALACALLLGVSLWRFRRGVVWRSVVSVLFLLTLMGPSLLREQRKPVKDVAVVVVDRSPSQNMGKRATRTETALERLTSRLAQIDGLEVKIVEAPLAGDDTSQNETKLFGPLDMALSSVPAKRRAGVILLTDGQVHDIPENPETFEDYGPVQVLLSGEKDEKDRRLVLTHAPAYGVVGQDVILRYKIEDTSNTGQRTADVTLTRHDGGQETFSVPVGAEQTLKLPIGQPGQNVFALEAAGVPGEITLANNKAAVLVNGVRDRLKVLLVSGRPHAGGRTWRDLLTSDPGVDLVHFTILREPDKFDFTPTNEMALIAFPFHELFQVKLNEFDLIIFDRYHQNNILPDYYYENIARYVKNGGAFLEASGPSFSEEDSIYTTPLKAIIPGAPGGKIYEQEFTPTLTDLGKKHPVTAGLTWKDPARPGETYGWGPWLRQVDIVPKSGDVLMSGVDGKPLLLLDRMEKGRVAQIASDQIWLWSRGYKNGGPHAELLRRVVHWLMKEPELDERALDVQVSKNVITVRKQDYKQPSESIAMTPPDGEPQTFTLEPDGNGWLSHRMTVSMPGVYAFEDTDGTRKFAVIGTLNPPELSGVVTSAEGLMPLVNASRGGVTWLSETPDPAVEMIAGARRYAGAGWICLKRGGDYTVAGVEEYPLLPVWLSLLALLCGLATAWWREGQRR